MPMFRQFDKDLFKLWSFKMAYILGFIFADGAVFKNKRGAHFLEVTSTDPELIYKIKKIFNSNHKVGVRKKKNLQWKTSYRLQIGSKEMVADLEKYGVVQNKSLIVRFPQVPKKFLADFVRGYFDGDGGVHLGKYRRKNRNNRWQWSFNTDFTCGSKPFLESLLKNLNKFIPGGFIYRKDGAFSLCFSRRDSLALFEFMYHNASAEMFLERKYNTFLKAFGVLNYKYAGVGEPGVPGSLSIGSF